eukprot:121865_1
MANNVAPPQVHIHYHANQPGGGKGAGYAGSGIGSFLGPANGVRGFRGRSRAALGMGGRMRRRRRRRGGFGDQFGLRKRGKTIMGVQVGRPRTRRFGAGIRRGQGGGGGRGRGRARGGPGAKGKRLGPKARRNYGAMAENDVNIDDEYYDQFYDENIGDDDMDYGYYDNLEDEDDDEDYYDDDIQEEEWQYARRRTMDYETERMNEIGADLMSSTLSLMNMNDYNIEENKQLKKCKTFSMTEACITIDPKRGDLMLEISTGSLKSKEG